MPTNQIQHEKGAMEIRRIHISSKRQITIPAKYYNALGLSNEIDCIYTNDMLILIPVKYDNTEFGEEILSDLIDQGYSGQELLKEFKRLSRQVRPAIEKLITEADSLAKKASINYIDRTDEIFGTVNETED